MSETRRDLTRTTLAVLFIGGLGTRLLIPTAPLRRLLGFEEDGE